jgi:hypothetical protein
VAQNAAKPMIDSAKASAGNAHVLGGHLLPEHTLTRPGPGEPLRQYQKAWADEYAADEQAVAWLLRSGAKHLKPTDVAIWPGLLLNFFALGGPAADASAGARAVAAHRGPDWSVDAAESLRGPLRFLVPNHPRRHHPAPAPTRDPLERNSTTFAATTGSAR